MNVKPGCKLITGTGRGCPGVEGEDTRHPPPGPARHCVPRAPHLSAAVNDITEKSIYGVTQIYFCPQRRSILSQNGGYLSGENLVSMKNLNGFCGDSGAKCNLFLIWYSRYEKEKNWMSDGLKLAVSPGSVPQGRPGGPRDTATTPVCPSPRAPRRTGNLKPTYRKPLGRLPITQKTTFPLIPCLRDLWLHFTVIEN